MPHLSERADVRGVPLTTRNHTRGVKITMEQGQSYYIIFAVIATFVFILSFIFFRHMSRTRRSTAAHFKLR